MAEYLEFELEPGVSVRLRTYPAPASPVAASPATAPPGLPADDGDDGDDAYDEDDELPEGYGGAVPVAAPARVLQQAAELSRDALRLALSPLRPLLQEVHDTLVAVPDRPQEFSVEFGVQLGADLKLGIVGGSAEASLTVSATWKLPEQPPPDGSPAP
ncbi:CU044_2847 family protein [Kitasatospora phosalacinea]|uniref:CU044_2847 family protein n=1 Tax=Kitasatospora phosalacinea TaxID=2065 RepID=UPI0035D8CEB4